MYSNLINLAAQTYASDKLQTGIQTPADINPPGGILFIEGQYCNDGSLELPSMYVTGSGSYQTPLASTGYRPLPPIKDVLTHTDWSNLLLPRAVSPNNTPACALVLYHAQLRYPNFFTDANMLINQEVLLAQTGVVAYPNVIAAAISYRRNVRMPADQSATTITDIEALSLIKGILTNNRNRVQSNAFPPEEFQLIALYATIIFTHAMSIIYKYTIVESSEWYFHQEPNTIVTTPKDLTGISVFVAIDLALGTASEAMRKLAIRMDAYNHVFDEFQVSLVMSLLTQSRVKQIFAAAINAAVINLRVREGHMLPEGIPQDYLSADFTALTNYLITTYPYRWMVLKAFLSNMDVAPPHILASVATPDKLYTLINGLMKEIEAHYTVMKKPISDMGTLLNADVFSADDSRAIHVHHSTNILVDAELLGVDFAAGGADTVRISKPPLPPTIVDNAKSAGLALDASLQISLSSLFSVWQYGALSAGTYTISASIAPADLYLYLISVLTSAGGFELYDESLVGPIKLDDSLSPALDPQNIFNMVEFGTFINDTIANNVNPPLIYAAPKTVNIPSQTSVGIALRVSGSTYYTASLLDAASAVVTPRKAPSSARVHRSFAKHSNYIKGFYVNIGPEQLGVSFDEYINKHVPASNWMTALLAKESAKGIIPVLERAGVIITTSNRSNKGTYIGFGSTFELTGIVDLSTRGFNTRIVPKDESMMRILSDLQVLRWILDLCSDPSMLHEATVAIQVLKVISTWSETQRILQLLTDALRSHTLLLTYGVDITVSERSRLLAEIAFALMARYALSHVAENDSLRASFEVFSRMIATHAEKQNILKLPVLNDHVTGRR